MPPVTKPERRISDPVDREFLLAFWKIHILHHAEDEHGVYGLGMLEELHDHGYRLSPGTLYPILSRMARRGWIKAVEPKGSRDARVYRITPAGAEVLQRLRGAIAELKHEVGERRRIRGAESPSGARSRRAHHIRDGVKSARSE
jgi:DNA-binding PadR family transcriptional regulator